MERRHPEPAGRGGQYLTFRVARIDFAIQAAHLHAILLARELEPVAPSPGLTRFFGEWICGFARIHGRDIPVVDLRGLLHLPLGASGRHACIVVVEITTQDGSRLVGFIADHVVGLIHARERDFNRGKLRFGGRSLRVLDPEVLLAAGPAPDPSLPAACRS